MLRPELKDRLGDICLQGTFNRDLCENEVGVRFKIYSGDGTDLEGVAMMRREMSQEQLDFWLGHQVDG